MAKVRRGEQLDPTGQYVKDGTLRESKAPRRQKLDVAKNKYPFGLLPDGTVVPVPEAPASTTNPASTAATNGSIDNPDTPPEFPPVVYPGNPSLVSTFVSSIGQGGSGPIVDLKLPPFGNPGYYILDSDLNKGAGGSRIYYFFTRSSSQVLRGEEYDADPTLSVSDPIVAYDTKTKDWFYQSVPQPQPDFFHIWDYGYVGNPNTIWKSVDLNDGAGGKYIYSYQAKKLSARNGAAPFLEIGILSGNSTQIQPPAGWIKWPQDLNEGAGGDYIYFCYKY